jgi:hypothetical protein
MFDVIDLIQLPPRSFLEREAVRERVAGADDVSVQTGDVRRRPDFGHDGGEVTDRRRCCPALRGIPRHAGGAVRRHRLTLHRNKKLTRRTVKIRRVSSPFRQVMVVRLPSNHRFDVQHGRIVNRVQPVHVQDVALDGQQFDGGHADAVGPVWAAQREDAALRLAAITTRVLKHLECLRRAVEVEDHEDGLSGLQPGQPLDQRLVEDDLRVGLAHRLRIRRFIEFAFHDADSPEADFPAYDTV